MYDSEPRNTYSLARAGQLKWSQRNSQLVELFEKCSCINRNTNYLVWTGDVNIPKLRIASYRQCDWKLKRFQIDRDLMEGNRTGYDTWCFQSVTFCNHFMLNKVPQWFDKYRSTLGYSELFEIVKGKVSAPYKTL